MAILDRRRPPCPREGRSGRRDGPFDQTKGWKDNRRQTAKPSARTHSNFKRGLPIEGRGSQEVLLTSHAPFVPSDVPREQVHIFAKDETGRVSVRYPEIETYGATF